VRTDTVNPPVNETRAAELLRAYLEDAGVECELLAKVPERANLVARIRGRGGGPSLAFLTHTDTVLADPAEWARDPWSGDVVDGEVWGRGALDMKGQVAASAVALAALAREGFRPNGDLVFVAAADEEVGDGFGLQWLVREHPDAVRCDFAINEGGGDRVVLGGRPIYLCATAEKMSAPFRLRVRGRSGHASMPAIADNALVKAARLVEAVAGFRPQRRHVPETEALLELVLGEVPPADEAPRRAEAVHPLARTLVEPLLAPTFTPTMMSASQKRNVIPALAEIVVDSRLQPGQTPEEALASLRAAIGDDGWEYELIEAVGGTRSPVGTPLWEAVEAFVAAEEPAAAVAPIGCAGFTDSHWLRDAFGTVAYGFFPMRTMDAETAALLVHSADERAHVDDLDLGVRWLRFAAERIGALSA
jgi:acetylornithine deacetylase/succinyl-diaminopimelate desuccinylase-like protein